MKLTIKFYFTKKILDVCQMPKGVLKTNQNVNQAGMFSFKVKTDRQGSGDTCDSDQPQIKANNFLVLMQSLNSFS